MVGSGAGELFSELYWRGLGGRGGAGLRVLLVAESWRLGGVGRRARGFEGRGGGGDFDGFKAAKSDDTIKGVDFV